jgi:hypothetical protein
MIQLRQLEDKSFIQEFDFENKEYLETLLKKLKNFLNHLPVPYSFDFDFNNNVLILRIGGNKKNFKIDMNIYYADFLTLIKKWIIQFYPQYYVDEEYGVILKIFFQTNTFLFFNNGIKELRYTGKRNKLLSLSQFLKTIRKIEDKTELKEYIFEESTLVKTIDNSTQKIFINYPYEMMKNFFKINFDDLKAFPITKTEDTFYYIGKYVINFNDKLSETECIEYLVNRKNQ